MAFYGHTLPAWPDVCQPNMIIDKETRWNKMLRFLIPNPKVEQMGHQTAIIFASKSQIIIDFWITVHCGVLWTYAASLARCVPAKYDNRQRDPMEPNVKVSDPIPKGQSKRTPMAIIFVSK